ncbi:hypothetical protein, partial [Pseudoflavonifractor sp. 60]|uniref:hypothetical protein n=1 Tax=Pseudoflavonifractor sp. 60 TaxID=2304576 RepID=UPI0013697A15
GSFLVYIIAIRLFLNHSPSEWFSLYKKRRRLFSKSAAFAGAQKAGDALLTSPAFCAVVHLFVPPRFPLPLKTLILLVFSMFSYGNAL